MKVCFSNLSGHMHPCVFNSAQISPAVLKNHTSGADSLAEDGRASLYAADMTALSSSCFGLWINQGVLCQRLPAGGVLSGVTARSEGWGPPRFNYCFEWHLAEGIQLFCGGDFSVNVGHQVTHHVTLPLPALTKRLIITHLMTAPWSALTVV